MLFDKIGEVMRSIANRGGCVAWKAIFVAFIICGGSLGWAGGDMLASRYVSTALMLYNELATESGSDFLKASGVHADVLRTSVERMEQCELDNMAVKSMTDEAGQILRGLKSAIASLERSVPEEGRHDPNAWAKENIEEVSQQIGELINGFQSYLNEPFVLEGPEKLCSNCRKDLNDALKAVRERLSEYTSDLTLENAEDLCLANRKAIVYLFFARFSIEDAEGKTQISKNSFDVKAVRQFRGDINRTIYWNRVLKKKTDKSDVSTLLTAYSLSELRRLRVVQAVIDGDMKEATDILMVAYRANIMSKTN